MKLKLFYFTFCKIKYSNYYKNKRKQWSKKTNLEAETSIMSDVSPGHVLYCTEILLECNSNCAPHEEEFNESH